MAITFDVVITYTIPLYAACYEREIELTLPEEIGTSLSPS